MLSEAKAIRQAISELNRPYRQSPYPMDLRKRIIDYILSRRPDVSWVEISEEINVPINTMWKWCRPLASRNNNYNNDDDTDTATETFLPIVIKEQDDSKRNLKVLSIRTPGGYCLEGLSKEDAVILFERLP
jgi:hypothetical protein